MDFTPAESGSVLTVASLPAGFRPIRDFRLVPGVVDGSSAGTSYMIFAATGGISCYMGSAKRVFVGVCFGVD